MGFVIRAVVRQGGGLPSYRAYSGRTGTDREQPRCGGAGTTRDRRGDIVAAQCTCRAGFSPDGEDSFSRG